MRDLAGGNGGQGGEARRERRRSAAAKEHALEDHPVAFVRRRDTRIVLVVLRRVGIGIVVEDIRRYDGLARTAREFERVVVAESDAEYVLLIPDRDEQRAVVYLRRAGVDLELHGPCAVCLKLHGLFGVDVRVERRLAAREGIAVVAPGVRRGIEKRCADGPVAERAETASRRPFAVAEIAFLVRVDVARARGAAVVAIRLARRAVHDFKRRLGDVLRRLGELSLVVVVDVQHGVRDDHLAHRGLAPREVRVPEQAIVARERREVVSVCVAVALRIHLCRLRIVDHALVVAADVVVDGVRHFAGVHPAREVPHQAVVVGRDAHRRRILVGATAEERELLVEKRRHLVVEAEQGGGQSAVVKLEAGHLHRVEVGAEADRRIEGIGVRLVPEEVVEVGQPGNGELELLVRVRIADAELERHGLGLGKDGLVELYEADARQVVLVEGHVALVGRAGLADHRNRSLGLVFHEVAHALRKGRHVVQHALHPPLGERRRIGPLRPLEAHHRIGRRARGGRAVAHRVVGVDHVGERVALLAYHEPRKAVGRRELLRVFVFEVRGHHAVGARAALAPLEDVVFRRARERFRVDDRELLRKEVEGILARDDPARVVLGHDLEEVHVDRVAGRDAHQLVRRVVLDDRHVVGGAHREYRVVVARLVVDDVFGGGDGTVPRRLDPPLRKRVDGGAPRGLARVARRLVHERL